MAAAEDGAADGAAVDGHRGGRYIGSVAAAVDVVDLGVALGKHFHRGCAGDDLGSVAAAIDVAVHDGLIALMARGDITHNDVGRTRDGTQHLGIVVGVAVTTAEDIARDGAVIDIHIGVASIGGQVAAAVDVAAHIVVDCHSDGTRRTAVDIVTAEDVVHAAAIDGDSRSTVDEGRMAVVTQAAAIDVAVDGTAVDSHIRSADIGQSATAVDIIRYGAAVDVHIGAARHIGQVTAAVDVATDGSAGGDAGCDLA